MIFPTSSADTRPIPHNLLTMAQKIEERSPSLHVLAAREFRYPVQQQELSIQAEQYRKMNLLEKFILLAATEISPRPSLEELADALGLDPIFIRSTVKDLHSMQSITSDGDGLLHITEEGEKSLSSEIITEEPIVETRYLIQDALLGTMEFSRFQLRYIPEDFADLSFYLDHDMLQFFDLDWEANALQDQLQAMGLDLHDPDNNRFVTEIMPTSLSRMGARLIAIFVLYNALSDNPDESIIFEARSPSDEHIPEISKWLDTQLQQGNISLEMFGLHDDISIAHEEGEDSIRLENLPVEPDVEERLETIRQQALTQLRLKEEGQTLEKGVELAGTSLQLRDMEIRPAFLKALQDAQELIIIYSPWMNEQVVNNEFISLLEKQVQRGVRILIGYGIGQDENAENRPVPPNLLRRLQAIQSPEGTPGIIAEWLGNSHAKEVIVDLKVHFSGSHNWLSYRGDRFPRGETVYQVTIATEVEKAYNYLAQRFIEHAANLWRTSDEDSKLALCLLAALGYEQTALDWIQEYKHYKFMPLWLKCVLQGVSVGRGASLLAPLQKALPLCCTIVEKRGDSTEEITALSRKVLKRMAQKNQQLTITFINNNLSELQQLGLDQYVRELNTIDSRKQDKKMQDYHSSNPTQRQDHHRNGSKRNH